MNELEAIAATFGTSDPVFTVTVDRDSLGFDVLNKYTPPKTGEPVHDLLVDKWREGLDKRKRRYEAYTDIEGAYRTMVSIVHKVALNSSPLKNPKQSRLFKWLDDHQTRYNDSLSVGYIALYRYIIDKGIKENRDNTNPHAKNVIAILELIREKYEN
jgi:hypothetical protein